LIDDNRGRKISYRVHLRSRKFRKTTTGKGAEGFDELTLGLSMNRVKEE